MQNEIEMKKHVLDLLKEFLMKDTGGKFKPKEVSVEMISKPHMVEEPSEPMEMEDEDHDHMEPDGDEVPMSEMEGEMPEDDEEEGKKPKMSLKDFLASK